MKPKILKGIPPPQNRMKWRKLIEEMKVGDCIEFKSFREASSLTNSVKNKYHYLGLASPFSFKIRCIRGKSFNAPDTFRVWKLNRDT